jgi:hypothetical protein
VERTVSAARVLYEREEATFRHSLGVVAMPSGGGVGAGHWLVSAGERRFVRHATGASGCTVQAVLDVYT